MQEKTEIRQYTEYELQRIGQLLDRARTLAREYRDATGGAHLGITGEVAEYEAAVALDCSLWSARTPGYDLTKDEVRYQVKGYYARRNGKQGSIPTIKPSRPEAPWDYALLVMLDEDYRAEEIYQLSASDFELFIARRADGRIAEGKEVARQPRAVNPRKFKELAGGTPVWRRP